MTILDGVIPTTIPDEIVFYMALCHITYVFSVPSADPFLHDRRGSELALEEALRRQVENSIKLISRLCNAYWSWLEKEYKIDMWATPKQAHKRMKEWYNSDKSIP